MENGQSKDVSPDFNPKGSQGALMISLTVPENKKWSMLFRAILDCCHMNNGSFFPLPFPGHQRLHLAWDNWVGHQAGIPLPC